jgi:hypothetical protein
VLRRACELGRVDLIFEVSFLGSHTATPRRGHFEAKKIVFDEQRPLIDGNSFVRVDWGDLWEPEREYAAEDAGGSGQVNTVERSTFGSDFVALRIAVKQMEALRYKLRMFGVLIDGPGMSIVTIRGLRIVPVFHSERCRRSIIARHASTKSANPRQSEQSEWRRLMDEKSGVFI